MIWPHAGVMWPNLWGWWWLNPQDDSPLYLDYVYLRESPTSVLRSPDIGPRHQMCTWHSHVVMVNEHLYDQVHPNKMHETMLKTQRKLLSANTLCSPTTRPGRPGAHETPHHRTMHTVSGGPHFSQSPRPIKWPPGQGHQEMFIELLSTRQLYATLDARAGSPTPAQQNQIEDLIALFCTKLATD